MMKTRKLFLILFITSLFLFSLLPITNVSADIIIIQQTGNNSGFLMPEDYTVMAQTLGFTMGTTITKVEIYFNDPSSDASDMIRVGLSETLDHNSANWETYANEAAVLCSGWVEFNFTDYTLIDTSLFLMVKHFNTSGIDNVEIASDSTDPFSWDLFGYDGSWSSELTEDITFRIYGEGVNQPPVAAFGYTSVGLTVNFSAASSYDPDGTITTWWWDWTNDGGWDDTTSGETVSHTYPADGPYTCKLRVIDNDGGWNEDTESFTLSSSMNQNPVAFFTCSTNGLTVSVDGSASSDPDGTIVGYQWDWTTNGIYDDTGVTQSHTYTSDGTYNITLRVMDNGSATNMIMQRVTVTTGGSSSSGFVTDNTMTYIIIAVVAAIAIGAVIYFGPTMKKGGRKKK